MVKRRVSRNRLAKRITPAIIFAFRDGGWSQRAVSLPPPPPAFFYSRVFFFVVRAKQRPCAPGNIDMTTAVALKLRTRVRTTLPISLLIV